jgi:hypothetical protein
MNLEELKKLRVEIVKRIAKVEDYTYMDASNLTEKKNNSIKIKNNYSLDENKKFLNLIKENLPVIQKLSQEAMEKRKMLETPNFGQRIFRKISDSNKNIESEIKRLKDYINESYWVMQDINFLLPIYETPSSVITSPSLVGENNYKNKYLKYKNKYLDLKNNIN